MIYINNIHHAQNGIRMIHIPSSLYTVSFAEYRLFYRALLQKRPIILRSLLVVATPYKVWGGYDE